MEQSKLLNATGCLIWSLCDGTRTGADLLKELQKDTGVTLVFITHNLGIVAELCEYVIVMYAGKIVEEASVADLFRAPAHPYTQGLIRSIPRIDLAATQKQKLEAIRGVVPSLLGPPPGCRFAPRCPHAREECTAAIPPLKEISPGHKVACVL